MKADRCDALLSDAPGVEAPPRGVEVPPPKAAADPAADAAGAGWRWGGDPLENADVWCVCAAGAVGGASATEGGGTVSIGVRCWRPRCPDMHARPAMVCPTVSLRGGADALERGVFRVTSIFKGVKCHARSMRDTRSHTVGSKRTPTVSLAMSHMQNSSGWGTAAAGRMCTVELSARGLGLAFISLRTEDCRQCVLQACSG